MSIPPTWPQIQDFFGTPLVIEPSSGQLSSDAGLLPVRQFDQRIGLTRAFADALDDPRDPGLTEHSFLEMVRSRVYGILAGYEDQNDHDTLRTDPVFKLVADRSPEDHDLASQPTLSRFESALSIKSLKRLRDVFLDQFVAAFDNPPCHLTFDLDAVDDPAHGHQQLTFWHGYYDQNQYLPQVITCADNDQFVMLSLRPGNVNAALGADDDLAYLVTRLRQVWPDVVLHFRGDCGFGVPAMYDVCERLRVSYTFGLSANAVLQRETEGLLAEAVAAYERERQAARQQEPARPAVPSRLFTGFWYQAGTWPQPRWVVAKAEAHDRGTNRRFVVTNRPGAVVLPGPTYDEYAARGESENRNKEFKCDLAMDRLSDHRFVANYFRLYLHAAAMNLLVRLRRFIAEPLPAPVPPAETAAPATCPAELQAVAFPTVTRHLRIQVVGQVLWYRGCPSAPVMVVVLRDPLGQWRDEVLVATDPTASAEFVIQGYCRRWSVELAFFDSKQYLGLHDPRVRSEKSVERAHPMAWFVGSLTILWYCWAGPKSTHVVRARPWYGAKVTPTFTDMLGALRLQMWEQEIFGEAGDEVPSLGRFTNGLHTSSEV